MDSRISDVVSRIRSTRIAKGLTIIDLANKAHVSRSQIFYLESNRKIPTLTVLYRIADALEVDISVFFDTYGDHTDVRNVD